MKKRSLESLFYNNRFLMVFSIIVAIAVWASVKINYSDETTRYISDIKVNVNTALSQTGEYEAFYDTENIVAGVEVAGKAYNINQYALSKDDIIIETSSAYVDAAGYKVLTLTAKIAETSGATGVEITKIEPSSITVYYDRKTTGTFNVEARLENDMENLVSDEFTVGQPVPSMSTVEVTGPATILNKLTKVYFKAQINEDELPLTSTKEVPAEIAYQLDRVGEGKYLVCEGINDESNPATVTVPLYVSKEVPTAVKFVNQPGIYSEEPPEYKISPDKIGVIYSSSETEEMTALYVGTVDFSTVSNTVNYFEFPVDEKLGVNIVDKSVEKFSVTLDMSSMSKKTLDKTPGKIVFVNQDENFTYSINYDNSKLNNIVVMGPAESLKKITAEDIQIEINVSSLSKTRASEQTVEVSNISISSDKVNDCWIYGKYEAAISVEAK
ncbi:MAG: hypothetical protein IJW86_08360 [Clostridia bacterium]|nr:hypothetical protein [Clostridia bacterium]